jgi:hypothetical protein
MSLLLFHTGSFRTQSTNAFMHLTWIILQNSLTDWHIPLHAVYSAILSKTLHSPLLHCSYSLCDFRFSQWQVLRCTGILRCVVLYKLIDALQMLTASIRDCPDNGDSKHLRNISQFLRDYIAEYLRRLSFSRNLSLVSLLGFHPCMISYRAEMKEQTSLVFFFGTWCQGQVAMKCRKW